jgi:probable rRNA maturation factor
MSGRLPARPALQLSLQFADTTHRAQLPRHAVRRWLRAALLAPAQLTVRIVGAEEGLALNRDFRGKAYATNVLTFGYELQPLVVADLVLCAPVVEQEALAQGKPLNAHYATCWCTARCMPRVLTTRCLHRRPTWKGASR